MVNENGKDNGLYRLTDTNGDDQYDKTEKLHTMAGGGEHGLGKKKIWASDGAFVWFRRKLANPATLERHNRFLATGEYKHVGTQDDVEIYELMPG